MNQYFRNILIPVDFTRNTEVAVKKALELAEQDSVISLIHVRRYQHNVLFPSISGQVTNTFNSYDTGIEKKLDQWKRSISETLPYITVNTKIVTEHSIQQAIVENARDFSTDLIIIGKRSYHPWFSFLSTVIPGEVAKKCGAIVLSVKSGTIYSKAKTMVVPITNDNALHKLEIINAICKKFNVKIYLATFANTEEKQVKFCTKSFLQIYQLLKGYKYQVGYAILNSNNKTKAILRYAENLGADILLVDRETETRTGWFNQHISDIIPEKSKLQVWTV